MPKEKATRQVSNEDRLEPAMKELTEVARSLHELLRSYGPLWYTAETDARLRNALAEADSALLASETRAADFARASASWPTKPHA